NPIFCRGAYRNANCRSEVSEPLPIQFSCAVLDRFQCSGSNKNQSIYMVAGDRLSMSDEEKSGIEQTAALRELLSILDLETLEMDLFRGNSPQVGWQRVFGGQVIGQALIAAQRTVDP